MVCRGALDEEIVAAEGRFIAEEGRVAVTTGRAAGGPAVEGRTGLEPVVRVREVVVTVRDVVTVRLEIILAFVVMVLVPGVPPLLGVMICSLIGLLLPAEIKKL